VTVTRTLFALSLLDCNGATSIVVTCKLCIRAYLTRPSNVQQPQLELVHSLQVLYHDRSTGRPLKIDKTHNIHKIQKKTKINKNTIRRLFDRLSRIKSLHGQIILEISPVSEEKVYHDKDLSKRQLKKVLLS